MISARTLGIVALGFVLSAHPLHGQSRSHYRDYQLGGDLASVAALAGVAMSEAKVIHARPALMQDLQWRRGYARSDKTGTPADPVQQIAFSFYNDQLAKMVVDYDRDRTAGMTDADMIEAISTAYGEPLKPAVKKARVVMYQVEEEFGAAVARWGDPDFSVVLYRASYATGFRLIVTSPRLEALARTAEAQAIRLDEREAPERELARQKKELEGTRAAQEKARLVNKAAFRP
jgi:hypothetical protein